ncbi:hypothetical protein [Chryseobacterium sp. RU33C]|uniref:hypothetical protein n=1 Tax=Chryseobacterium sp. RU33C TaxID=1907398 RepID=UPI0009541D56|nr:hypothetical protein [Chryseobacterium sp. RU33C]SIQ92462.1 hypothetical protein SAMN05880573_112115 [Chryseobacterium sp. RU33C]
MKNKLRKIVIDNNEYLYSVTDQLNAETEINTLTLKVFLREHKQTPLIVEFVTFDHYIMGQPLKSGIKLRNKLTNSEDTVNLNEPKYIKQFILLGLKNGWSGVNSIAVQDGLDYLCQLGFEVDQLIFKK